MERMFLPKLIAFLNSPDTSRLICDVYVVRRTAMDPARALRASLEEVLNQQQLRDLVDFTDGHRDDIYGSGKGSEFYRDFSQTIEEYYERVIKHPRP